MARCGGRHPASRRKYRSQDSPAGADFATGPRTARWKTDFGPGRDLGQPSPAPVAEPGGCVAVTAMPDRIDGRVIFVSRPVAMKVVEERQPVERQTVRLEIRQRE